jgi:hypothetical protein
MAHDSADLASREAAGYWAFAFGGTLLRAARPWKRWRAARATGGREQREFRQGVTLSPDLPLVTALDGVQLTACSARADAAAPSGGMAVMTAAWGLPVAVMAQVRVRT